MGPKPFIIAKDMSILSKTNEPFGRQVEIETAGPLETERVGETELRDDVRPGRVIALYGDLGAGKTCLIRGIGRCLGVRTPVLSPSYDLVHEYAGRVPLLHVDLYRLDRLDDILELGLEERWGSCVTAIEWAERMEPLLPPDTIRIRIRESDDPQRRVIGIERGDPS